MEGLQALSNVGLLDPFPSAGPKLQLGEGVHSEAGIVFGQGSDGTLPTAVPTSLDPREVAGAWFLAESPSPLGEWGLDLMGSPPEAGLSSIFGTKRQKKVFGTQKWSPQAPSPQGVGGSGPLLPQAQKKQNLFGSLLFYAHVGRRCGA